MGRKQETLLIAVDSKLPRGTGASKTLKQVGSLWRRLDLTPPNQSIFSCLLSTREIYPMLGLVWVPRRYAQEGTQAPHCRPAAGWPEFVIAS